MSTQIKMPRLRMCDIIALQRYPYSQLDVRLHIGVLPSLSFLSFPFSLKRDVTADRKILHEVYIIHVCRASGVLVSTNFPLGQIATSNE